ncbi:hypothetical protein BDN72DRAFT_894698 [Pluteus cervinus]|uniref:Uncharacterized protein n=1 Tax=Pluteus cervinus TaxID=181527 RepID=A0ACD3B2L9_9AGAR|nr:hypothetical protein BDN72DRAFT_894698 [Pluteus cervinus]
MDTQKPSRKGKERDPAYVRDLPQPTDIDEKLTALRRRNAGPVKPRDRSERERERLQVSQPSQAQPTASRSTNQHSPSTLTSRPPHVSPRRSHHPTATESRPLLDTDYGDFARMKISPSSPRNAATASSKAPHGKLYNPDTDPIPVRRPPEPEPGSDATGSSYVVIPPRTALNAISTSPAVASPHRNDRDQPSHSRQLFDHRKDDPVRFSVLARPQAGPLRPTPSSKDSAGYVSASSTSSYASSVASSNFTLSSTTDGSSASSNLFDQQGSRPSEESSNNMFADKLKKLYRAITYLETKVKQEDAGAEDNDDASRMVQLKAKAAVDDGEEKEREKWNKQIEDHKRLADLIHNLLEISLSPSVPASLRTIPTKYNIVVRLWTYAFHKLLESLRRASFTSNLALEHLQDFIYYAYTFYTGLYEEGPLETFKSGWLEALGDLARYRMAVAAMVNSSTAGGTKLTAASLSEASSSDPNTNNTLAVPVVLGPKSVSDAPAARIDDSPSPSVGIAAARALEVEPEKELWRNIAKDWYAMGLSLQPGTGKLHHHLGLLCREVETEELKGIYHFAKSLTALHPFLTSRESVLPIWSVPAQARRSLPDARVSELFVLLHGMLFTNIQLDDFQPTLARLVERLELDGAEEREWVMMAVINIASILEYGKPTGVIKRVTTARSATGPGVKVAKRSTNDERMDVDEPRGNSNLNAIHQKAPPSPALSDSEHEFSEHPASFTLALKLMSTMLSLVLRKPRRRSSQYAPLELNPYLTVILTFLATVTKDPHVLAVLERGIPWEELAAFFASVPEKTMVSQSLIGHTSSKPERWMMLTTGCAPPLPEDWCMRGMEWASRKVHERGFWKSGTDRRMELEVLDDFEVADQTDGRIEDDNSEPNATTPSRWVRIIRCGVDLSKTVNGFTWIDGTKDWKVEGALAEKVQRWREQDEFEREEERKRLSNMWNDDSMEVDDDVIGDGLGSEESDEDEADSEEVKELKARRRFLRNMLRSQQDVPMSPRPSRPRRREEPKQVPLAVVPGYTTLVIDTNILLSSLSMFASLIESLRWTVVVPLPVIMELDGLASNTSSPQLAIAAKDAISYIASHIRSHTVALKVQTSKGNYLSSLSVRTEQVDFARGRGGNEDQNMDDLILKAAIWQEEHWIQRSQLLSAARRDNSLIADASPNTLKVVLLSLDRNLRLKARARQLPAASEKDLASILATGT